MQGVRVNEEGVPDLEENFEEAVKAVKDAMEMYQDQYVPKRLR